MPTPLHLARGSSRSYLLTFLRPDGTKENLTNAIFAAFVKRSVLIDSDANALVNISNRVRLKGQPDAGEAILAFTPADTAALDPVEYKEWVVRATLADGRVVSLLDHMGPLVFYPLQGVAQSNLPKDTISEFTQVPGDFSGEFSEEFKISAT